GAGGRAARRRAPSPGGARIRLRDHGVTPFVIGLACVLTLAAQLAPIAFILVLFHVADGVVETRNEATLIGFTLIFLALVVMSGMFTALRAAL
ncbi:hypothetical protein ABTB97_21085, partial [Acinetobacter baumannii]